MSAIHRLVLPALGFASFVSCHSASEPAPQAPTTEVRPVTSEPVAAVAPGSPSAGENASGYPMCHGQHVANAESVARSGPSPVQLSPAFLDEMPSCRAADGIPSALIAQATDGKVNAKGDYEFANIGVSCHYHSGSEFVTSREDHQVLGQGELHCIFPSDDAKSPRVYGGHVMCRNHAQGEPHGKAPAHDVDVGASCPAALLHQLESCHGLRCCDDGTLTNSIGELAASARNDIRPDFRICDDTLEVDCELLAHLTVHPANSPALGGVGQPSFLPPHVVGHSTASKHQ
jgi:hypothetical protein